MTYRNRRQKKSLSKTIKLSESELAEIEAAVEATQGQFSPSVRTAAVEWARSVLVAARSVQAASQLGVVTDDGDIRYLFG